MPRAFEAFASHSNRMPKVTFGIEWYFKTFTNTRCSCSCNFFQIFKCQKWKVPGTKWIGKGLPFYQGFEVRTKTPQKAALSSTAPQKLRLFRFFGENGMKMNGTFPGSNFLVNHPTEMFLGSNFWGFWGFSLIVCVVKLLLPQLWFSGKGDVSKMSFLSIWGNFSLPWLWEKGYTLWNPGIMDVDDDPFFFEGKTCLGGIYLSFFYKKFIFFQDSSSKNGDQYIAGNFHMYCT